VFRGLPGLGQACAVSCPSRDFWLIDSCITQLKAQGTSRTCNESKEEEKKPHPQRAPYIQVCFGDFLASVKPAPYVEVDDYKHADKVFFFFTLVSGPRRSLGLKLSDTRVCEPEKRARHLEVDDDKHADKVLP